MQQKIFTITENAPVAPGMYKMVLAGDASDIDRPGMFVQLALPGKYLRRPISVHDADKDGFTIIYKVVGAGTEQMADLQPGEKLDVLTALGNGFDVTRSGDMPLLVGGGVGSAPMLMLAKQLVAQGKTVKAVLGFASECDIFSKDELEALGVQVTIATADGSCGVRGFVTDALSAAGEHSYVYACGPNPMLKALDAASDKPGEYSFEERMGCGFGACMGCTCKTKYGNKRICKDGPVLTKEEIVW